MPSFHKVETGTIPHGTESADLALHIEITRHHVHTAIELIAFKQILAISEYNFLKPLNVEQIENAFENLFQTQQVFKASYGKVLVSTDVFPDLLPKGFENHTGNQQIVTTISDSILSVLSTSTLIEKIKQLIPLATITDLHSVFLQQVLHLPAGIYTLVMQDSLVIAVIELPGKLLLFNRYEYHTAEDFLYFLLLVCDELKTDREKIPLVFCGKIQQQSKIYNVCYHYFSNIIFLKPDTGRNYSKALQEIPQHIHFTLYSLSANHIS